MGRTWVVVRPGVRGAPIMRRKFKLVYRTWRRSACVFSISILTKSSFHNNRYVIPVAHFVITLIVHIDKIKYFNCLLILISILNKLNKKYLTCDALNIALFNMKIF